MKKYLKRMQEVMNDEEGAAMVEYALVLLLVAVVAMAGLTPLGVKVKEVFGTITSALTP